MAAIHFFELVRILLRLPVSKVDALFLIHLFSSSVVVERQALLVQPRQSVVLCLWLIIMLRPRPRVQHVNVFIVAGLLDQSRPFLPIALLLEVAHDDCPVALPPSLQLGLILTGLAEVSLRHNAHTIGELLAAPHQIKVE